MVGCLSADAEDLGAALRAYTLGCRFTIFHLDLLRVLDLGFLSAFHAICSHMNTSF